MVTILNAPQANINSGRVYGHQYRTFEKNGKNFILDGFNYKTIGCYDAKYDGDSFTKHLDKLKAKGAAILEGEPTKVSRYQKLNAIRKDPVKRARYNKLKLANNPELKARYERMCKNKGLLDKVKDFAKTTTGKWTMIGGGALILAAIVAKCMGGKKEAVEEMPQQ